MILERFISLAEPEHLSIQVSENEEIIYTGQYNRYPKERGKSKIRGWYIENGKMVITL